MSDTTTNGYSVFSTTWLPLVIASVAGVALVAVASPSSALALARTLLLTSAVLAVRSAFTADGRFFRPWAAATAVAALTEPLVLLSQRPLLTQPELFLTAIALAATAAAVWAPEGARSSLVLAAPLSAGLVMSSAFPTSSTLLGVAMWSASPLAVSLLLLARDAARGTDLRLSPERAQMLPRLTLLAAAAASAGFAREFGRLRLEEVDFLYPSAATALAGAALLPAAVLLLLLSLRLRPAVASSRPVAALMSVLLLIGAAGPAFAATLPLEPPPGALMGQLDSAEALDLALTEGRLYSIGAGPRPEYRGTTFEECDRLNNRDCFITYFDDIALRYGVSAAVDVILEKVRTNQGYTFPAHCHQAVHNLGQVAYQLAREFSEGAAIDPQVCGTGFTHGLWEQQMVKLGTDVWFSQTGTLCDQLNMDTPWYKWTCSHILGHLLSTALMDNPAVAVEYCNAITDPQALLDCHTGAWMNFFQDDAVIAWYRSFGSLQELFEVCYGAAQSVKLFCYQELFPVIYPLVQGSDFLAAEACLRFSEPTRGEGDPWMFDTDDYTDRCLQGISRAVAVSSAFFPEVIEERCLSMPAEAHSACLTATAASVVLNTGSTAAAFPLCGQVPDDDYRLYCYFWTKHARRLLQNGPNSQNMPAPDEVRLPEGRFVPPGGQSRPFSFPASS